MVLDEIRRAYRLRPQSVFARAVPSVEYLVALSQAGILSSRGKEETECRIDWENDGEVICVETGEPGKDCRQSWCRFAALMRMRLVARLRAAYARERRRHVGL